MRKHQAFLQHLPLQVILGWTANIADHLAHSFEHRRVTIDHELVHRLEHVEGCQEPSHPEDVVQMFMAQDNARQVFEAAIGPQDLPLRPFTTIDEPFEVPVGNQRRGHIPANGRDSRRCT